MFNPVTYISSLQINSFLLVNIAAHTFYAGHIYHHAFSYPFGTHTNNSTFNERKWICVSFLFLSTFNYNIFNMKQLTLIIILLDKHFNNLLAK